MESLGVFAVLAWMIFGPFFAIYFCVKSNWKVDDKIAEQINPMEKRIQVLEASTKGR